MVVPDLQVPLHDREFVEKLIEVAGYIQPDKLLFIGDLTDSTEVGRWVKGRKGEFTGDLQAAFDEAADIIRKFRNTVGWACEMYLQDSNHDSRTQEYINANAPALSSLRALDLVELLSLDLFRVSYLRKPHDILPGVLSMHGHERSYSQVPGKWGLDRSREHGKSIIYGHTHTPLLVTSGIGTGDTRQTVWSMNVGHAMNMSKATYLTDDYATWNQAFGLVHYENGATYPELVVAQNGKFHFDGEIW